jgi:hypothetical protein
MLFMMENQVKLNQIYVLYTFDILGKGTYRVHVLHKVCSNLIHQIKLFFDRSFFSLLGFRYMVRAARFACRRRFTSDDYTL